MKRCPHRIEQWVYRSGDLLVAANFSDQTTRAAAPPADVVRSSLETDRTNRAGGAGLELQPWEGVILKMR